MTDDTMIKIIRELNQGKKENIVSKQTISATVELVKLWEQPLLVIKTFVADINPSTVYFIKDGKGTYLGGVQDAKCDLHWVMLPEYRKKGYLTKSMKEYILPHIFKQREIQTIEIDRGIGKENYAASSKVAFALGFKETFHSDDISIFELKAEDFFQRTS